MLSQGDDKGRHNEGPDVLSEAAMINAYYICHNVQVSPGKPNKIGKGQRKRKLLQNLIHFPPLQITSEEQVKLLLKSFNKFPQERETKIWTHQDLLYNRGFYWEGAAKKGKKGKKGKRQ